MNGLNIGFFEHKFRTPSRISEYLKNKFNYSISPVHNRKRNYLEDFDVVIIEQNGFNDYIENDGEYFNDYIARGGIVWIMHQDYRRWSPYFLPHELGQPLLVTRYMETIPMDDHKGKFFSYLMPEIEEAGRELFRFPNRIDPEDMIYWEIPGKSFGLVDSEPHWQIIRSAADSCIINCPEWQVLGSYCDAAVSDGALIVEAKYGKGLIFWNQILFPEEVTENTGRCFEFWDKYIPNVLYHFAGFCDNLPAKPAVSVKPRILPEKNNYKMAIHLHSLDWYGADESLNSLHAALRFHGIDIGILAVKDAFPYGNNLDTGKYSDDKVLFLPGQEFHPFNWDLGREDNVGHNGYHMLSMGPPVYSTEFTKSLYDQNDIDAYLHQALAFIRENGGVSCATHPDTGYWRNYPYDAVDIPLWKDAVTGSDLGKFYQDGGRITAMVSVDLWGVQRLSENPAVNFIYLDGPPSRETVLAAIRRGSIMPALHFVSADVRWEDVLPGGTIDENTAANNKLHIAATAETPLTEMRIYNSGGMIYHEQFTNQITTEQEIAVERNDLKHFVRIEIESRDGRLVTNPIYIKA